MRIIELLFWLYALASPICLYLHLSQTRLWLIGIVLLLVLLVKKISGSLFFEEYTVKKFEKHWIADRKKEKGLKYQDRPGCYVILIYRHPRLLPFALGYEEVYVGQSTNVYSRVHNHINRKGNGDVYADIKEGKSVIIDIYPCKARQLNTIEKKLIRKYHADRYYNRTAGGGKKRNLFGK